MAPFGRNFLKARLKNRSENKDSPPGKEIQVWVCQEEKIVCGISKRTTCSHVVQALLEDHRNVPENQRVLHGETSDYCLLERWKGFERALPPLTRILPLWAAWGEEKPFIQFVLVRAGQFAPQSGKKALRYGRARARSKQADPGPGEYLRSLPIERQRRMVRKAFRKLEKIRKEKEKKPQEEETIDRMVQLILTQDQTIQQQIHRMRELDLQIDCMERRQWEEHRPPEPGWASCPSLDLAELVDDQELQEDPCTSDTIDQLETLVSHHLGLIGKLSHDIDMELLKFLDAESLPQGATASGGYDPEEAAQFEELRRELEESMQRGALLHAEAAQVEEELQHGTLVLRSQNCECEHLAGQLSHLSTGDSGGGPGGVAACKPGHTEGMDTDSDTGISSTHSQDSLSPCRKTPPSQGTEQ
uniref:Ras association domain family member 9 n=1 Tax=Paramormyrops kingsleyae TaxID=1676925 RepID=A0A3B3QSH5_9TELE|nr:ras association domain-containing protein 9 [Paramormyrops kingsleyae]